jgi:hypothetical protein
MTKQNGMVWVTLLMVFIAFGPHVVFASDFSNGLFTDTPT